MMGHLLRLYQLVVGVPLKDKIVVELGVRNGESTTAFLAAVNDSGGHLFSVDILECQRVRKRLTGEPNWTFVQRDDMDVVKEWNQPIDHLFIDTDHAFDHTLAELREWGKWVKFFGLISLHDIHTRTYRDVPKAIRQYLSENPAFKYTEYSGSYGLGLIQKRFPSLPEEYWETCRWYLNDEYNQMNLRHVRYPRRYRAVAKFLNSRNPKPETVLDVGCLDGYGVNILRESGFDAHGIEIYGGALRQKQTNVITKASIESLPFKDKSFDAVVSTGVLEHIHESGARRALYELDRIGKINKHRIHMSGFGKYWDWSWHVTVRDLAFWQEIIDDMNAADRWFIEHEP